jgi:hypothetical protein
MSNNLNKVGPCGTCCTQCIASKDDPNIIKMLADKGFPREALPCKGCREIDGHCPSPSLGGKQCGIYTCAENQKFKFCFECNKCPCDRLMPSENTGNYRYHNMKCFNLLYIQKQGVDNFCENAERIQKMYFNNTLKVVGESPQ